VPNSLARFFQLCNFLFGQGALDDQIALFGKVQPLGFGQGILQTLSIHLNSSGLRTWWVRSEYSVVNGRGQQGRKRLGKGEKNHGKFAWGLR
jgi:hypothetical protein